MLILIGKIQCYSRLDGWGQPFSTAGSDPLMPPLNTCKYVHGRRYGFEIDNKLSKKFYTPTFRNLGYKAKLKKTTIKHDFFVWRKCAEVSSTLMYLASLLGEGYTV